jgi:hypothetical protein
VSNIRGRIISRPEIGQDVGVPICTNMDHEACETELRVCEMPTCSSSPGRMKVPNLAVDRSSKLSKWRGETTILEPIWHLGGGEHVGIMESKTDASIIGGSGRRICRSLSAGREIPKEENRAGL